MVYYMYTYYVQLETIHLSVILYVCSEYYKRTHPTNPTINDKHMACIFMQQQIRRRGYIERAPHTNETNAISLYPSKL